MFTSRPYAGEHDFAALVSFLAQARGDIDRAHHLHIGDLTWQVFHMHATFDPAHLIQVWEDADGTIVGFVLLYAAFGSFDIDVQAQHRDQHLEAAMLVWAEAQLRQGADRTRSTLVHERDTSRRSLLEQHGFTKRSSWLYMRRSLAEPIPAQEIPPGFQVRHVRDTSEAEARATVLATAFEAPVLIEHYQHLMQAPGYDSTLDLVAVAPDQQFGAFAMCWIDAQNKVGQFEPVGTAPDFRRLGLGRAVLLEGMRRMKARGAEQIIVIVDETEEAAQALYTSVGLEPCWRLYTYSKGTR